MGSRKSPKPPPPPPAPAPAPEPADVSAQKEVTAESSKRRRGYKSTVLTSRTGLSTGGAGTSLGKGLGKTTLG